MIAATEPWPRKVDALIDALARGQHGVVSRAQLLAAGVPRHLLDHRLARGRLESVHHGVYRVGPLVSPDGREMAAVLACGGSAVVSHASAQSMWELSSCREPCAVVHVIVTGCDRGRRCGLRRHLVRELPADETTRLRGVPITTPARTLLDVAAGQSGRDLERALAAAERATLVRPDELHRLLSRHPRHRGAHTLRHVLATGAEPAFTRSEAEERLLALIRKAKLPVPGTNVRVAGYEVDFYWRAKRLVVEVDGFAWHSSARAFERDRDRQGDLVAMGIRVLRLTWRQLVQAPEVVLVRLATLLKD